MRPNCNPRPSAPARRVDGDSVQRTPAIGDTSAVQLPDVSYARSGDVAIAYQVVGAGAPDVVFMRGIAGDLVSTWDQPLLVRHVQGLADSIATVVKAAAQRAVA